MPNPEDLVFATIAPCRAFLTSDCVCDSYDDVVEAAGDVWSRLVKAPGAITSIEMRQWHDGHT